MIIIPLIFSSFPAEQLLHQHPAEHAVPGRRPDCVPKTCQTDDPLLGRDQLRADSDLPAGRDRRPGILVDQEGPGRVPHQHQGQSWRQPCPQMHVHPGGAEDSLGLPTVPGLRPRVQEALCQDQGQLQLHRGQGADPLDGPAARQVRARGAQLAVCLPLLENVVKEVSNAVSADLII